ncbi:MAG TPA: hypothetical protein VKB59_02015 [Micromonosporaceae bacterium]|nr:hypothetical protein [Micromonosporaceae bacterium]
MGRFTTMRRRALATLSAALLGATAIALGACDGSRLRPIGLLTTPDGAHIAYADRGDLSAADFELASGVTTLVVRSGDLGRSLYAVATPGGAGVLPAAVIRDGHVVTQLVSSGISGPSVVDVTLNDAVAWTIHLDGGATEATVDMRAGGLVALDFGAGVSRIDVTVPAAAGTLPVRMSGGASEFAIHAPAGEPARVALTGGAGSATIDGDVHTGIAGGTIFTPTGWDDAVRRIDVDNTAGVASFVLDRY